MPEGVSMGWNTQDAELDKAMSLFDIDSLQHKSRRNDGSYGSADNDVLTTCIFQTAEGNSVDISMESLNRARSLMNDVGQRVINKPSSETVVANFSSNMPAACVFQTARGGAVKISDESLNRARNLLLQEDESVVLHEPSRDTVIANDSRIVPASCIFQTARGNAVKVSNESLSKVRNLLQDCEPVVFVEPSGGAIDVNDSGNLPATCVFQTARGGTVKISEESLSKARNLLQNDEPVVFVEQSRGTIVASDCGNLPTAYVFQTARGGAVKISDESLNRARNLLLSEDESIVLHEPSSGTVVANDSSSVPTSCVFQTARGNAVKITDESSSKARNLLQNDEPIVFVESCDAISVAKGGNNLSGSMRISNSQRWCC